MIFLLSAIAFLFLCPILDFYMMLVQSWGEIEFWVLISFVKAETLWHNTSPVYLYFYSCPKERS